MSDESKGAVSPERIWLQVGDGTETPDWSEVTWCRDRIDDTDAEYVRADLLAAAEARVAEVEAKYEDLKTRHVRLKGEHEATAMDLRTVRGTWAEIESDRDRLAAANAELQAEIDRINDSQAASLGAEINRLAAENAAQAREIERLREAIAVEPGQYAVHTQGRYGAGYLCDLADWASKARECAALAPAADASGEVTP